MALFAKECPACHMKPCIGGKGPGSCVGGKKGAGERRSEKAGLPENTVGHSHKYELKKMDTWTVKEGRKEWSYYNKEFHCTNRKGICTRPVHVDSGRIRLK